MENVDQGNVKMEDKGAKGKRAAEGDAEELRQAKHGKVKNEDGTHAAKRKAYTEAEKELVVSANKVGGEQMRHQVASMLKMPLSTADHVVKLYDLIGSEAFHDHRRGKGKASENLAHLSLGQGAKKNSSLVQMISRWVHFDSDLTWETLRELVNLEIFRKICGDRGFLQDQETIPSTYLSEPRINQLLADETIRSTYDDRMVQSAGTVASWMDGVAVSRKHHMRNNADVNSPEHTAWRLSFARDLLKAISEASSTVIFIDQVPIWLHSSHVPLGAPEAALGKPINQSVNAFMALDANDGLFAVECYKSKTLSEHDVREQKHGAVFDEANFTSFLNYAVGMLAEGDDIGNKNIFIVCDIPAKYLADLETVDGVIIRVKGAPNFQELQTKLLGAGKRMTIISQAPFSPTVNLGEFLNFKLLRMVNERLHELVLHEMDHQDFLSQPYAPGRPNYLLDKVTSRALRSLSHQRLETRLVVEISTALSEIIAAGGALDVVLAMNRLDYPAPL